ncbi:MAG: sigma 54-interacting transcriptional regulator [Bryobacterales bacterium]|nr:sigma 54-interacting transcriptional regulator [Bryobacterales bacterium]
MSSTLDPSVLPDIILAIAEQRRVADVLQQIMEAVTRQPGVALARVWLIEDQELRLRASAGLTARTDGEFSRVDPSQPLKLAHIARTGEAVVIPDLSRDQEWVRHPAWIRNEGLTSFVGHPLRFRSQVLGVFAVFLKAGPSETCFRWLRMFADHAALALANARAYEEIERLTQELELERDYLREEVAETGSFGEILGSSPALDRMLRQLEMVAATNANVLIQGESGSGKELVARALHTRSARAGKPLVKVNCGAIPRELFESEFFGHVRGSFTGAVRDRVGRFELADGGTLFLDEVGELPLDLQTKLLRVLQEGEFERVGEERTRRVDVRIIAATNRNLRAEVDAGRFRLDLFYRLSVFPMEVPPLRERRGDIAALVDRFVQQACARFNVPRPRVAARDLAALEAYDWPGNVRELQNVVERAVILARGGTIEWPLFTRSAPPRPAPDAAGVLTERQIRDLERSSVVGALRRSRGRVAGKSGAAELLGIPPTTLASRIKSLGIDARPYRGGN